MLRGMYTWEEGAGCFATSATLDWLELSLNPLQQPTSGSLWQTWQTLQACHSSCRMLKNAVDLRYGAVM